MVGFSWVPVSGCSCHVISDAVMVWHQHPLCCSQIISLEVCEAREYWDFLMGSLMAYKATVPRHRSAREPDLLLNPGDQQTGPFFSQHLQAAFGSLHLLSKRPRTGQHFLHSKTMQGISLLRQLDPFQRRRAAKFPPPSPQQRNKVQIWPLEAFCLLLLLPLLSAGGGEEGALSTALPGQG